MTVGVQSGGSVQAGDLKGIGLVSINTWSDKYVNILITKQYCEEYFTENSSSCLE